jgi:(heptosyl)LPS beta-1,4-glucosyltransferase
MNPSGLTLSIAIITLNEERNLGRCLGSLQFSRRLFQEIQIIVVDAESRDNTVAIAREWGAQVFIRPWQGYADQRTWALSRCSGDWILVMDADEELTADLVAEIENEIPRTPVDVDGYNIARRTFFCGKWIRHCGWYPGYQLRLFRRDTGRYPKVHLHEGVVIEGRALYLKAPMNHYSYDSIGHYVEKTNRYTDLEILDLPPAGIGNPGYRMIVEPLRKFLGKYFGARGLFDGWHGFILCALFGFYEFIKYAKLWVAASGAETGTHRCALDKDPHLRSSP